MLADQINTLDPNSLAALKRIAKTDSAEGLRVAAKQFEALFLQMVLKSMREATPSDGLLDNDQTKLYQSLLDQQLAQNLAGRSGTGLADALVRQLGRNQGIGGADASDPAAGQGHVFTLDSLIRRAAIPAAPLAGETENLAETDTLGAFLASHGLALRQAAARAGQVGQGGQEAAAGSGEPGDFVDRLWPHAQAASRSTGIPAHFILAQAALETGWGKGELRRADGSPSYNVFNIKAGASWRGDTVQTDTTEYAGGKASSERARFRAYGSYAEAFADYARLLAGSPRYSQVLGSQDAAGFARGLQDAGYATDPMYASKLTRIIVGNTLRSALAG